MCKNILNCEINGGGGNNFGGATVIDEEKTGCVHCAVRERNNKDVERNERELGGIKTQDRGSREERREREESKREPGQRALRLRGRRPFLVEVCSLYSRRTSNPISGRFFLRSRSISTVGQSIKIFELRSTEGWIMERARIISSNDSCPGIFSFSFL